MLFLGLFIGHDSVYAALGFLAFVSAVGVKRALVLLGSKLQVFSLESIIEELVELSDGFLDDLSVLLIVFVTADDVADTLRSILAFHFA